MSLGRKRLAYIGGEHTSTAVDRAQGFVRAIEHAGGRIPSKFVLLEHGLDKAGELAGHRAAMKLLAAKDRPDALFCYNDLIAIGAIEAVLERGLRVPEDVAVLGCGNLRYAGHLRVPLSSIDQRVAELGEMAGDVALRVARGYAANLQPVMLAPRLVVRRSTQAG